MPNLSVRAHSVAWAHVQLFHGSSTWFATPRRFVTVVLSKFLTILNKSYQKETNRKKYVYLMYWDDTVYVHLLKIAAGGWSRRCAVVTAQIIYFCSNRMLGLVTRKFAHLVAKIRRSGVLGWSPPAVTFKSACVKHTFVLILKSPEELTRTKSSTSNLLSKRSCAVLLIIQRALLKVSAIWSWRHSRIFEYVKGHRHRSGFCSFERALPRVQASDLCELCVYTAHEGKQCMRSFMLRHSTESRTLQPWEYGCPYSVGAWVNV